MVCDELPGYHFEVKRSETLQIYKALAQAFEDAHADKIKVVAHKKNQKNWVIILDGAEFIQLLRLAHAQMFETLDSIRAISPVLQSG